MRLATRGERFCAALVDVLILFGMCFIFMVCNLLYLFALPEERLTSMIDSGQFIAAQFSTLPLLLYLAGYLLIFGWFLRKAQSPGKALLQLQVVDKKTGLPLSLGWMLVREIIGKTVSRIFLGFGYWSIFWDKDNQCWHDKIADTIVMRKDSEVGQGTNPSE